MRYLVRLFLISCFLAAPVSAWSQQAVLPCYQVSGAPCQVVNATHGLPVTISGPISGPVNLGTSTSATSPRITGDATSGFYTAGAALVDVAISGSKITEWSSTGQTTTGLSTANGFSPTSSTATGNRLYLPSANAPGISANGIEAMQWNTLSGGVDYFSVTPGKSGTVPSISIGGSTTNQSLNLAPAGTGSVTITAPTAGAALDLSSNTNSLLLPTGTTGQRPTGVNGMIRYNSTTPSFEGFANGSWGPLGGGTGSALASANVWVGNASNLAAAVPFSGDVTLQNTGNTVVNSYGGGNVPGSACAANTGTSAGTVPLLNSNGLQFSGTGDNFSAPIAIGTTSVNSIAAQTTIATDHTQITAGTRVPVASTTSVTIGNTVTGTNIAAGTQLARASNGSTDTSVTAQKAAASGQTAIAVNTITGVFVNQLVYDDTTAAGLSGQTYISTLSGSGSNQLSTTGNGASNTGQKVLTVNSTTNAAAGMLIYDNTTACIPAGTTIVSFVTNTSITLSNNITGSNCANADTIVAYPTLGLNQAIPATGVAASDTITSHPTLVLSQASTGIIGNAATLTLTANATDNATGALQILGGAAIEGDVYISQGIYYANGQKLVFVPPQDNTSLAIGASALSLPSSATADNWVIYNDIAIGQQAMGGGAMTNAAVAETGIGYQSLKALTSGAQNTAIGWQSLTADTSGGFNTVVGRQAGLAVTTGNDITAIGRNAGAAISTNSDLTAIGYKAMALTTGADNTSLGSNVGSALTSGANNTVLGFSVAPTNLTTGSNNILLGTSSSCDLAGSGNSNETHICGSSGDSIKITGTNTASSEAVTVNGSITFPNVTTGTNADFVCMASGNTLTLQSSACTISQRNLKENFGLIDDEIAYQDLMGLSPIAFNMKATNPPNTDPNATHPQYGFIAEDVAAVDNHLAIYENDMQTPKSYRQEAILALLVRGYQLQQKEINAIAGNAEDKILVAGHKCMFGLLVCAD